MLRALARCFAVNVTFRHKPHAVELSFVHTASIGTFSVRQRAFDTHDAVFGFVRSSQCRFPQFQVTRSIIVNCLWELLTCFTRAPHGSAAEAIKDCESGKIIAMKPSEMMMMTDDDDDDDGGGDR